MRARIWYAINTLEKLLVVMTGRPVAIQDKDCTVPLPKPMDDEAFLPEDSSSEAGEDSDITGPQGLHSNYPSASTEAASYLTPPTPSTSVPPAILYFAEYAKLSKITMEAINSLYCPETMKLSWFEVQQKISDLEECLNVWRAGLPPALDFAAHHRDQSLTRQVNTIHE